MGLTEIVDWLKAKYERDKAEAVEFGEQHLPVLADFATKAAANPVVISVLKARHLSPTFLTALAAAIDEADAELERLAPPETPAGADAEPDPAAAA
jgi:hypothetical protein